MLFDHPSERTLKNEIMVQGAWFFRGYLFGRCFDRMWFTTIMSRIGFMRSGHDLIVGRGFVRDDQRLGQFERHDAECGRLHQRHR